MELTALPTLYSIKHFQQRGVAEQMIDDAIHFGELIRKQGLRYFIITKKCLSYFHKKQYNERVQNTVVILNRDNSILTVYKNSKKLKNIKLK